MKTQTFILCLCISLSQACAQNFSIPIEGPSPAHYEHTLNNASYVFEGTVIDTMYYNGITGLSTDLYVELNADGSFVRSLLPLTSHRIKIIRIFRGADVL